MRRYTVALIAVAAATALRLALDPVLDTRFPFATVFAAVLVVAWYGGFGPALVASLGGAAAAGWFLLAPRHRFALDDVSTAGGLVLYLAVSLGIAAIGGAMHGARRRAERSVEELRVTLESIGDAVVTTDVEGRVTSLNSVATSETGRNAEAARGRPADEILRLVDERTRDAVPSPVAQVLREGGVVGLANRTLLVRHDGSEHPIDGSAAPIRDRTGALIGVVIVFRDVTERRRTLERLRASEDELSDLFENANVGLRWLSPEGVILRANRAELDMLGYPQEEYVGRSIHDFHEDAVEVTELLGRIAAGESLVGHATRMRCKDGSVKDVIVNSSGRWEGGRLLYSRCFTLDLTAQRQADEAQALFAAVVESSDDAIVTKRLDGIVTSWNAGAERLFGYGSDEMIGRSITTIIPPERLGEEQEMLARLGRGERVAPFDTIRLTKEGRRIDISLSISPLRDRHGRIIGASKLARDVTERNRAAEALRESEERFRALADNIAQFAWMADGSGEIFWYNKRWFDYTGTTLEQVSGWGWQVVHHPDHVERVVEKIRGCFERGEVWEDTFPLRGADGSYRWFLSRAVPIRDAAGRVTRWFGTNTDVSAQREAEQALLEADRRKDEFLATLAHELRNPLAPLGHSLEVLKRAGEPEPRERALAAMSRQFAQLARLVDDLLDIARISRDRLELRREPVEIDSVIQHAVESCQPLAESAGLELSVRVPAEPLVLDADSARLAQVFSNLLNNACKFTQPGGRIWLDARREGAAAVVTVRDNGRGIEPELVPRVFDLFAQFSPTGERSPSGLGIGLTLVRRLVELHGGTVEASSGGLGRGSTFVVRLPLPEAVAAAPPSFPEPPPVVARRVLIVDDNVDAAESLSMLLRMSGHETMIAYDGEAAFDAAKAHRPDVILLDIGLPKVSGYDVARRLRAEPWGRELILVALTGWGQDEDRRRSHEAGFDHHLVKPVDVKELERVFGGAARGQA